MLKWPEQDVLNVLFGKLYLELPWIKYNCPPIMYIMKTEDVINGVFKPIYKDEAERIDDFEGYADYTEAVADSASVIHYIGESKPWKEGRPQAATYDVFDQFYYKYKQ